jgi:hypothetical protein
MALEVNPSETILVRPAERGPGEQETPSAREARLLPGQASGTCKARGTQEPDTGVVPRWRCVGRIPPAS